MSVLAVQKTTKADILRILEETARHVEALPDDDNFFLYECGSRITFDRPVKALFPGTGPGAWAETRSDSTVTFRMEFSHVLYAK